MYIISCYKVLTVQVQKGLLFHMLLACTSKVLRPPTVTFTADYQNKRFFNMLIDTMQVKLVKIYT